MGSQHDSWQQLFPVDVGEGAVRPLPREPTNVEESTPEEALPWAGSPAEGLSRILLLPNAF